MIIVKYRPRNAPDPETQRQNATGDPETQRSLPLENLFEED